MYTEQQIRDMSAREFLTVLDAMGRAELEGAMSFLRGYSPVALAAALNRNAGEGPRGECGAAYLDGAGAGRKCQRQPHDGGSHWIYDADNNAVHWSAPPVINGDRHPAPAAPVAEEVAEP